MRHDHRQCAARRGMTIIDALAAIAVLAALLAIAVPGAARVRSASMTDQSLANLEAWVFAHATYAADWNDRQYTAIIDEISEFGDSVNDAFPNYHASNGGCSIGSDGCHPPMLLGWRDGGLWAYWMDFPGNWNVTPPLHFSGPHFGFGSFRILNNKGLHDYVDGRFYGELSYAPADVVPYATVEPLFLDPYEYIPSGIAGGTFWSSYALSPAAMFAPTVMRAPSQGGWQDPWLLDDGFTSPRVAQALYPHLKTRMLEHHWIGAPRDCNPAFADGTYDGCEPYYFNHGIDATPAALFFDGQVRLLPNAEVQASDELVLQSTGGIDGLWSRDTPFGNAGYFLEFAYDGIVDVSHHVLTTGGIEGRDTLGIMGVSGRRVHELVRRGRPKRERGKKSWALLEPEIRAEGR